MTENEAVKVLSDELVIITGVTALCRDFEKESDMALAYRLKRQEAMKMAIQALKEIQNYRKIGTVEECWESVEKQIQKTLEFFGDCEDGELLCPSCQEDLWDLKECGFNNCPYCGQAIQWNKNLEGMEDE